MSDEQEPIVTAHEAAEIRDPEADIMALTAEIGDLRKKLEQRDLEYKQLEYEMRINGALARLNIGAEVLGGIYSRKGVTEADEMGHIEQAERVADKMVSRFEAAAEKMAQEWVKQSQLSNAQPASSAEN